MVKGFRQRVSKFFRDRMGRPIMQASPARILVGGFVLLILSGAVLLNLPVMVQHDQKIDFLTALFTSTSAVCVTGLAVVDTGTHWTIWGQIVILILIQVGGLGFMTMAALFALLLGHRISFRQRLIIQQAMNQNNVSGIVRLVKYVLVFTFSIELVFTLLLAIRWAAELGWLKSFWYGLFFSVSAFNNAGFDLFGNARLTGYVEDVTINLCITTLIIIGGIGISVVVDLLQHRKNFRYTSLHTKMALSVTAVLLIAGTLVIFLLEMNNSLKSLSLGGKMLASYFQAVTPRSAGYVTLDTGALLSATQFFIIILMFIGASPGSTGGGVRTTTIGALVVAAWSMAKGKVNAEAFRRQIGQEQVYRAMIIVLLAIFFVAVVALVLSITEQASFLAILFEATSAFTTTGLSMSLTSELTVPGRILIIITMFLGRIGPLTVVFALTQRQRKAKINYPEEKILIG